MGPSERKSISLRTPCWQIAPYYSDPSCPITKPRAITPGPQTLISLPFSFVGILLQSFSKMCTLFLQVIPHTAVK